MRADFPPPPASFDALAKLTPHEVVSRYPESLAVFRRHGADLREVGARPLEDLVADWRPEEGRLLMREIGRALSWRSPMAP